MYLLPKEATSKATSVPTPMLRKAQEEALSGFRSYSHTRRIHLSLKGQIVGHEVGRD